MKARRSDPVAYLFILPIFAFFVIYSVYPLFFNIYCSFLDWNGVSIERKFIGIKNYIDIFHDPIIKIVFRNTAIFFFATIFPQAIFGLVFAFIISKMKHLQAFFRAFFYFPCIIPLTIICITFKKIFEFRGGELNTFLDALGLDNLQQVWLGEPGWSLFSLIIINIWTYIGFSMFMYCVGITNIPDEYYDAARIDGATEWQLFKNITFPLLGSTHMTLILLGLINTVKTFDIPYITTSGGPAHSTEFFSTYMYSCAFGMFKQGKASAIVCVMLMLSLILTAFQLKSYGITIRKKK